MVRKANVPQSTPSFGMTVQDRDNVDIVLRTTAGTEVGRAHGTPDVMRVFTALKRDTQYECAISEYLFMQGYNNNMLQALYYKNAGRLAALMGMPMMRAYRAVIAGAVFDAVPSTRLRMVWIEAAVW
jgi:hypothetical protein